MPENIPSETAFVELLRQSYYDLWQVFEPEDTSEFDDYIKLLAIKRKPNRNNDQDRLRKQKMLEIKETTIEDIKNVQQLWADGDVMRFVGFPDGLHKTDEGMEHWLRWIEANRPRLNHFSIFEDGKYCGESFYEIDAEHKSAALDIKLFGFARGRGIAAAGLSHAIKEAFQNGAEIVWVDPNPENTKAIALYKRLGFQQKAFPEYLIYEDEELNSIYMELAEEDTNEQY